MPLWPIQPHRPKDCLPGRTGESASQTLRWSAEQKKFLVEQNSRQIASPTVFLFSCSSVLLLSLLQTSAPDVCPLPLQESTRALIVICARPILTFALRYCQLFSQRTIVTIRLLTSLHTPVRYDTLWYAVIAPALCFPPNDANDGSPDAHTSSCIVPSFNPQSASPVS
ncbi:hypothetical protein BDV06DRAFT_86555 [Aspergillus oleicola]